MKKDIDRGVGFDFVRACEAAALNSLSWIGLGEKEKGDAAACDAIRGMFDLMPISGLVTIGEGIKDESAGLFRGEKVGTWEEDTPRFDIALDPIDGTTNLSKGLPNAIACIAAALHDEDRAASEDPFDHPSLLDIPAFYLDKLAYGQRVQAAIAADPSLALHIEAPVAETIEKVARILGKRAQDVVVVVMDRERNGAIIDEVRKTGANLRMISDGDITAALAPAIAHSGIDLYLGIGGSPEGVLSAAGMRCLGGGFQAKIWARDEEEKQSLIEAGWGDRFDTVFQSSDLARGESIIFAATGILDSPFLPGIRSEGNIITTHSVLMRVHFNTVRFIEAQHDANHKTLHLRSVNAEVPLKK